MFLLLFPNPYFPLCLQFGVSTPQSSPQFLVYFCGSRAKSTLCTAFLMFSVSVWIKTFVEMVLGLPGELLSWTGPKIDAETKERCERAVFNPGRYAPSSGTKSLCVGQHSAEISLLMIRASLFYAPCVFFSLVCLLAWPAICKILFSKRLKRLLN